LSQRESKNLSTHETNTFEHVYLFQEMRVPSARRIRECESLLNGADMGVHCGVLVRCCVGLLVDWPLRCCMGVRVNMMTHFVHADGAFAKEIGSRAGRSAEHLKYGLWLAGQQLSGSQKASKAIHIYSNNLDPSAGGKPKDKCAPQPVDSHPV
jgi:hypothetical protein